MASSLNGTIGNNALMKRLCANHTVLVFFGLMTVLVAVCACIAVEQQNILNTPVVRQDFSTVCKSAQSLKITICMGTAIGQSFMVESADDNMLWSRSEFLDKYDETEQNQPFLYDNTFGNPDEYLFEALLDALFGDRVYEPLEDQHIVEEVRYNIVVFDDEGLEIMGLDLFFNMYCIKFGDSLYTTSPKIDNAPFQAAYMMSD